ncbi:hypothetical protein E4T42_07831 [Aureobasidium subglaciale]|nr:hypothetical protein E4T38_06816 [Aureobasidium subglaciale]KAI5218783.1 hypothetical protein E4T40_06774 [Aureobasidium subglaciale]KAI5222400.1 hypothetical protein E4T41_06667 [Aureobasidium subglaciale]KAI5242115.1 hypothetical protein E4T42_07831 [Aureobasidium subglaciale]KAI5259841.1 hypothetical protein E4T46_06580 [Aureobasidium subglaciale]
MPDHEPFLRLPGDGDYGGGMHVEIIRGNNLRGGVYKDRSLQLITRDFVPDGRAYQCNQSIMGIGGGAWNDYPGPVLATTMAGTDFDPKFYQDIDLVDFRDVVDWFQHWREGFGSAVDGIGSNTKFAKEHVIDRLRRNLRGIRANCQADVDSGRPPLEVVSVPARFPLYSIGDAPTSFWEVLDGLPCLMANIEPYKSSSRTNEAAKMNRHPVIDAMYTDLNPESPTWGQCDKYWRGKQGSFLIVDRQRNHLWTSVLQHFYTFFRDWIKPRMDEAESVEEREAFIDLLESEGSEEFNRMLDLDDEISEKDLSDGFRDHFFE